MNHSSNKVWWTLGQCFWVEIWLEYKGCVLAGFSSRKNRCGSKELRWCLPFSNQGLLLNLCRYILISLLLSITQIFSPINPIMHNSLLSTVWGIVSWGNFPPEYFWYFSLMIFRKISSGLIPHPFHTLHPILMSVIWSSNSGKAFSIC